MSKTNNHEERKWETWSKVCRESEKGQKNPRRSGNRPFKEHMEGSHAERLRAFAER